MYFYSSEPDAEKLTVRQQNGRNSKFRRQHAEFEARNFICAHIKRDDPASRRLVQYLSMQSHRLVVLVRDAENGRLLIKPPEDERWLYRQRIGLGRASKNEWTILKSVGPEFFEETDRYRRWYFSFKEYYDVYVWDLMAGEPYAALHNCVQMVSVAAVPKHEKKHSPIGSTATTNSPIVLIQSLSMPKWAGYIQCGSADTEDFGTRRIIRDSSS